VSPFVWTNDMVESFKYAPINADDYSTVAEAGSVCYPSIV
jgi:hypothetical protein